MLFEVELAWRRDDGVWLDNNVRDAESKACRSLISVSASGSSSDRLRETPP